MIRAAEGGGIPAEAEELTFRRVTGETEQVKVTLGPDEAPAPAFLATRLVRLVEGPELRQLRVVDVGGKQGYERLDNEILAGLRLRETTETVGYPPEVSRLYAYEATSADPYALLEPYQGDPLTEAGQYLLENEQHQFQVSLLTGLCWLAAAGIAHRGISPSTVRWNGRHAQITDFSMSTVIGVPRQAIGAPPWAAREQRPGFVRGRVSAHDDIWASGRLIFYVQTGEELTDRSQIDERPALKNLLAGVFGPPEERPSARGLLGRLNQECPVPRALEAHSKLAEGRKRFYLERGRKHPGVAPVAEAGDGEDPGEPGGSASEPLGQASPRPGGFPPPASEPSPPRNSRRLWPFPPQTSMIAGGLAVLQAAIIISLAR